MFDDDQSYSYRSDGKLEPIPATYTSSLRRKHDDVIKSAIVTSWKMRAEAEYDGRPITLTDGAVVYSSTAAAAATDDENSDGQIPNEISDPEDSQSHIYIHTFLSCIAEATSRAPARNLDSFDSFARFLKTILFSRYYCDQRIRDFL